MAREPVQTRGRPHAAYTLVEVSLATAVSAVILLGSAGAVAVASRALPERAAASQGVTPAGAALALAEELAFATAVGPRSATSIEFQVASRTGGAEPDTIRYEWSGTPGAPLRRTLNPGAGGVAVTVLPGVRSFALSYDLKTETSGQEETVVTTSAETLLARFDGWPGLTPTVRSSPVGPSRWVSQAFVIDQVSLPPTTTKVRFTRVRMKLRRGTSGGEYSVGVHPRLTPGQPEPGPTPLGSGPMCALGSLLPGTFASWIDCAMLEGVEATGAPTEFAVVVRGKAVDAIDLCWYSSVAAPPDSTMFLWTTDSGGSWSPGTVLRHQNDAPFEVYGTYEWTEQRTVWTTTTRLRAVEARVAADTRGASAAMTRVRLHNEPEVPTP